MIDLPALAFLRLRARFFDDRGRPVPFRLRDKRNTQDDPFDEFLAKGILADMPGVVCIPAPGPLITPDMVLCRSDMRIRRTDDTTEISGIEVKKLERTGRGPVARATGLDFNTTPPCGRIRVYDARSSPVDVRGFYLFVCLETSAEVGDRVILSSLALVDGNLLNEDFDLYLSVTGQRSKRIDLGTFSDGVDRNRPMLIFSNPLGIPELDYSATLVHSDPGLKESCRDLAEALVIRRRVPSSGETRVFTGYRHVLDAPTGPTRILDDPFPTPSRDKRTKPRGRFTLPFTL